MEYILSLDQGSSSAKAVLVNKKGKATFVAQESLHTQRPQPGWAEHDPSQILNGSRRAMQTVCKQRRVGDTLLGISFAAQRSTVLFWDKKTGKDLAPAISWQDRRGMAACMERAAHAKLIEEKTGLRLSPHYSASKIRWAMDHWPRLKRSLEKGDLLVGPVTTYLTWHLSRGEKFIVDPTMAARTLLMDLSTLQWDEELLRLWNIPKAILPSIVPSVGRRAGLRWNNGDVNLLAHLGDQQAALAGAGAFEMNSAVVNFGTGGFYALNTGQDLRRVPGLLSSIAWSSSQPLLPTAYLLEGTVNAVGSAFEWLQQLGIIKNANEMDTLCRQSKNRVFTLLALGGLGAPHWRSDVQTAFLGLTPQTTRADLARSLVESVGFLLRDIQQSMETISPAPPQITASGGVSRNNFLLQHCANILQRKIQRTKNAEATAMGSAFLAGMDLGIWTQEEIKKRIPMDRYFEPRMEASKADSLHAAWAQLFQSVCR